MNSKLSVMATAIVAAIFVTACGGGGSENKTKENASGNKDNTINSVIDISNVKQVLKTNADIAFAAYSDSVDAAVGLKSALATFEASPTQDHLDAARKAWLIAREPYGQTEVYRFRRSPIDSTNYKDDNGPEGSINAWPLGEALIDYVKTGTDFNQDKLSVTTHSTQVKSPILDINDPSKSNNIINSTEITIDASLLANNATADDEHDVISGYHAIEFLLWGQDLNRDQSADTESTRDQSTGLLTSGGNRPLSDFTSDPYAARRHTYLNVAIDKLLADLKIVRDGWSEGASYRNAFVAVADEAEAKQKLAEILTGMGTLSQGELAGERMQIAFSSNSQEDEHSCFSDNTHRDIWLNAEGVSNSFIGEYAGYDSTLDGIDNNTARAVSGYGLDDYLASVNLVALSVELKDALTLTETNYKLIDAKARHEGIPVDNLIMKVNRTADNPMYKTILSLTAQSSVIAKVATELGISGKVVDGDGTSCDTTKPDSACG